MVVFFGSGHFAAMNVDHPISHGRQRLVMGYYDYRLIHVAAAILEQLENCFSGAVVQSSGRLIT